MLKLKTHFKVHNVDGADEKLITVLREHSQMNALFDDYVKYKDLRDMIKTERKIDKDMRDKKFISLANKLIRFMRIKKVKNVRLQGFHY